VFGRQKAVLPRRVDAALVRRGTRACHAMRAVLTFVADAAARRAVSVMWICLEHDAHWLYRTVRAVVTLAGDS
jgi:hypothetical protein